MGSDRRHEEVTLRRLITVTALSGMALMVPSLHPAPGFASSMPEIPGTSGIDNAQPLQLQLDYIIQSSQQLAGDGMREIVALIPSWDSARGMPTDYIAPIVEPDGQEKEEPQRFRLRLALDFPLRTSKSGFKSFGFQGGPAVSPTLQASLQVNPHSYWFGNITFYRYLIGDRQRPWNPDFTYSFGYDDWHPNTFTLIYGNYGGNRLSPERGRLIEGQREERTRFSQGLWSLGYKFAMPDLLKPVLLFDDTHQLGCIAGANFTRRYTDLKTLSIRSAKKTLSLGCRYSTPSNLYINVTAFYYPDRTQQQPWDPDFTYGFGYFDYRPGTVTVQYNNYSGNRYPSHDLSPNQGRFRNGSISISWSTAW